MNTPIEVEYLPLNHRGPKKHDPLYTAIDADDYALVGEHKWSLVAGDSYVGRNQRDGQGVQKIVYLHRVLMGAEDCDGTHVDHKNGDRLDNRRSNLRVTDSSGNGANRT